MTKKLLLGFTLLSTTFFVQSQNLIISEIHYNPSNEGAILGDDLEFLEVTNIGTEPIDLIGYSFTSGVTFFFGANSIIDANQSLVIAKNKAVFDTHTGKSAFGQYTGGLKNTSETITLANQILTPVFSVTYSDISPWAVLADGVGSSLELVDPLNPNLPTSWVASNAAGGSPGSYSKTQTSVLFPIIVNEVLGNTSGVNLEKIELYNTSNQAVDISGWYLTDDRKTPAKYIFPSNTVVAGGEYKVFTSAVFGNAFSISSKGEEIYIFSTNANGLTGYSNGFAFNVSDQDQSYGLHLASDQKTQKFNLSTQTFGAANSTPQVGPLVFTDIMYNPDILTDEFAIIKNISPNAISTNSTSLTDSNAIRITGIGYKFDFKNPVSIASGESIIFTSIAPTLFQTKYGVPTTVKIYQYTATLSNSSDLLEIQIPIYRDTLINGSYDNHYKTMDEVMYFDAAPWSIDADGSGKYLKRNTNTKYANDPTEWKAVNDKILTGLSKKNYSYNTSLYPTFVSTELNIESEELFDAYKIINIDGTIAQNGVFAHNIEVSQLQSGAYLIILSNSENQITRHFVKK